MTYRDLLRELLNTRADAYQSYQLDQYVRVSVEGEIMEMSDLGVAHDECSGLNCLVLVAK
jgi:hypothetical protein